MPRRNRNKPGPSYRNLQIYHELAYNRRRQVKVAAAFGLSQVRVSHIGLQVKAWVDRIVRPRDYKNNQGMRLHLAIALERIRMQAAYEPLIGMFTGDEGSPRYLRRYVTVVGGQPLNTIEISEKPDFRLLNQAIDVVGRMAQLEAVANLGPLADLPSRVNQTTVHRYEPSSRHTPCAVDPAIGDAVTNAQSPTTAPSNPTETATNPTENRGVGVLESLPSHGEPAHSTCCAASVYTQPTG